VRRLLPALALAAATTLCWSAATSDAATAPQLDILVLAGQSNALGYQSYVVDPTTHKNVFNENHSAANKKVLLMWDESGVASSGKVPVPLDTPQRLAAAPSPVFGPEVGLARALYSDGDHHLLVVKVAFSGSSLADDWQSSDADFQALVAMVQHAESWATGAGWSPSIAGVYWMQGESDAMTASWASSYHSHLLSFIAAVRQQLDLASTTPFVIGEIDLHDFIDFEVVHDDCATPSCADEKHWNEEVMSAQRKAASKDVFVASTASLPRFEDFLHLTDSGELVLGRIFATLSEHHLT
jgi:Carbohydrate esterase, sialic acid-specific acetylesterase